MRQSIWLLHLSLHESAYVFVRIVYPNDVFVSVSGTHCFIWSVWVFVGRRPVWVELKVSVSASQEDGFSTLPVWSLDSTGNRRFQKTPGTCFPFKRLKKNKYLTGNAGDFSLLASMTSNGASGSHRPAELTTTERGREIEAKNDHITTGGNNE